MPDQHLEQLNAQIRECRLCPLGKTRTNAVPGEGNVRARVMFVGEAPGASEDKKGRPFCGRAGGVLDEMLEISGLNREDVFIGNILKCRPPDNRNPKDQEIEICTPYLDQQIECIKPAIICCLGNFSSQYVMRKFDLGAKVQGITKIHGNIFIAEASFGKIKILPIFHPAVVTYDINKKPLLAADFKVLKNIPK